MEEIVEGLGAFHHLNALPPTAVHGLDEHGVADVFRHLSRALDAGQDTVGSRHHGNAKAPCRADGIGLIPHGLHGRHRRPNEVDAVVPAQLSELGVLGQKANARMERIDLLELGYPHYGQAIEIAFIRRVAANAHEPILRPQHVRSRGLHVRVGLHEDHFDTLGPGYAYQLGRSAATSVNQRALHRRGFSGTGSSNHLLSDRRGVVDVNSRHDPSHHSLHGIGRHGDIEIDGRKSPVEPFREGMTYEPLHGAGGSRR